jgi:DNA invertase Pin-like site-specific DNA recombinase
METSRERQAREAQRAAIGVMLKSWGRRRRDLEAARNPLVRRALAADITKEEIHQSTGLGRTTIDRIEKEASDGR